MSDIKNKIQEDMKQAMRAKDRVRLGTIRLMLAAIKQKEVDERIEANDEQIIVILDKMLKQRRDSIEQYQAANRPELADAEAAEMEVIKEYLPQALTEEEITTLIQKAINETGASEAKDMGKVMGLLKPKLQGRADIKEVSQKIKALLS